MDLNGYTITTNGSYGVIKADGGCSIKNGNIVYTGTNAAIKVWNADIIEGINIEVTNTSGATIGGIVLQEGSTTRVNSIKNVTITGAGLTNGIQTYNCGTAEKNVIDYMENVEIDAVGVAMNIYAPCGTAENCTFKGGNYGIEIWIKGEYNASLNLVNCEVEGGETYDVFVHDEFNNKPGLTNNGTLTLTADAATGLSNGRVLKTVMHGSNLVVENKLLFCNFKFTVVISKNNNIGIISINRYLVCILWFDIDIKRTLAHNFTAVFECLPFYCKLSI